jgi:hypothetical protein
MTTRLSLQERVDLARQDVLAKWQLKQLIDDLWREVEKLRKHQQDR